MKSYYVSFFLDNGDPEPICTIQFLAQDENGVREKAEAFIKKTNGVEEGSATPKPGSAPKLRGDHYEIQMVANEDQPN